MSPLCASRAENLLLEVALVAEQDGVGCCFDAEVADVTQPEHSSNRHTCIALRARRAPQARWGTSEDLAGIAVFLVALRLYSSGMLSACGSSNGEVCRISVDEAPARKA